MLSLKCQNNSNWFGHIIMILFKTIVVRSAVISSKCSRHYLLESPEELAAITQWMYRVGSIGQDGFGETERNWKWLR